MSRPAAVGFLGNTVANLVVGATSLGYAALVPAMVVRRFGEGVYGTWYLAFQIAAYVLLLDLGSQYVVAKEVATDREGCQAARLASAAVASQAAFALGLVGLATTWAASTGQSTLAGLVPILGLAATASLMAGTVRAWFVGLERSHVPAPWVVLARLAALGGGAGAVAAGWSVVSLTAAVALPQLLFYGALLLWARRAPSPWARPDRVAVARLVRSSLPLAVWTVCGIIISGADIFVVRALDPAQVGRYAVALPLLAIPIGVVTAGTTAWLPRVAAADAADREGAGELTAAATTLTVAALALGVVPFVVFAPELVRLWAGSGGWGSAARYLQLLYLGSCLRFAFLPWVILILVRGQQGRITLAPVIEGIVNLVASLVLGLWLGALGVALGTLVGAAAALVVYFVWAVPRTADLAVTARCLQRAFARATLPVVGALTLAFLAFGDAAASWRLLGSLGVSVLDVLWWAGWRRSQRRRVTQLGTVRPADVAGV